MADGNVEKPIIRLPHPLPPFEDQSFLPQTSTFTPFYLTSFQFPSQVIGPEDGDPAAGHFLHEFQEVRDDRVLRKYLGRSKWTWRGAKARPQPVRLKWVKIPLLMHARSP
ncbi:hypothetical protein I3842_03G027000 [Carya illinoinensis]|uniref:Uncharacterized protein n=1 Tax=Carya illinoinensis TaxID=32201 RepID=A0A922FD59_CARIL|nr:hypothetical protein I3842_03G027000 [Carya illinoinensis]